MVQPAFSYNYDNKPFSDVSDNPIKAVINKKVYDEFDAVEWYVTYENTSNVNSKILSQIKDCDILLQLPEYHRESPTLRITEEAPKVMWMQGNLEGEAYSFDDERSAQEFSTHIDYLFSEGMCKNYYNNEGRSSDEIMPYFEVACKGCGYIVAIGWTGSWVADFSREKDGIRFKAGLRNAEFYLKPNETVRTASVLIMQYKEGQDQYNKFRDIMVKYYTPKVPSKDHPGLLSTLLWGSLSSEEMVKRINRYKDNGAKFEEYWVDAAWNGRFAASQNNFDTTWADEIGDWEVKKDCHPDGFKDVVNAAKEAGGGFLLWFEIEHATEVTPIFKEHPEYFIQNGDRYMLLDLGNPQAWDYAFNLLCQRIREYNVTCYRQDFNTPCDEPWKFADKEGRRGITEIYHVAGLYRLYDSLLKEFPHLYIDNCASGGRRLDFEMVKRSIHLYRTDYQCIFNPEPDVTNTHHTNISKFLPVTGCSTKKKMDIYAARSTYSASWGFSAYGTVIQEISDDEIKYLATVIDEYVSIRKYFLCHFHNFGSDKLDQSAWVIWQYHDAENDEGIVMAFRRKNSPNDSCAISLKELSGDYTFTNFDTKEIFKNNAELRIVLPQKYSSVIFKYNK